VSTSSRIAAALVLLCALHARAGEVRGRVGVGVSGVSVEDAGPIVVYLESGDTQPLSFALPKRPLELHQKDANFSPNFLVIAAGETVVMPNDDVIFHNVERLRPRALPAR
jgi:hypothetical protein